MSNVFGKKISVVNKIFFVIGAVAIILFSLFLSVCFKSEAGNMAQITEFMERYTYYLKHLTEIFIFENMYIPAFIWCLVLFGLFYVCWIFWLLLKPNKYIRGKEYGDAEWGDLAVINDKLISINPKDEYKVYYKPEPDYKKIFRKIFEDKKNYIK